MYHMKTATVRDLRYSFPQVEAWISNGEEVQLTKRGHVLGKIVPAPAKARKRKRPDFAGRLKAIFGDKKVNMTPILDYNKGPY